MHLNRRSDGKGVLIDYTGSADRHARHVYPSTLLYPKSFPPCLNIRSIVIALRTGRWGEAPRKGGESLNDVIVVLECLGHSSGVVPRRRSSNSIGSLAAFALPFL